jgi:CRP-like cAMP-binding protein
MIERHLARLRIRHEIGPEEEEAIRGTISEVRDIPAGRTIIRAEELIEQSTLVLDGLMCRYKDLSEGQRQIAEIHVPGDFADLHSYVLKRLDHSVLTLTRCRVAMAPHERIRALIATYPNLGHVYWFSTVLDAAIHREWVLSLGRRTAIARMAALFCELQIRLGLVGLADENGFSFGLNQTELAECLGLTPVHVNRTLRQLRERQLMTFRGGRVTIHDPEGLRAVAEFDPFYLYLGRQPRMDPRA